MRKIALTLGVLAIGMGSQSVWALGSPAPGNREGSQTPFSGPANSTPQKLADNSIEEALCFIPGAGGGSDWVLKTVPGEVNARHVPMLAFDVGYGNTVEYHAQKFVEILQKLVQEKPNLRCHIAAYSMGGLIMRYAANHLYVDHPTLGHVKSSELMLTMTTMSTPHLGTPLPHVFKKYFGDLDASRMELDEPAVAKFNDPSAPEYSPIIEGKPSYSYRTFINSAREGSAIYEQMGYTMIASEYQQRGLDPRSDGIVPFISMSYGTVVGDIHAPHNFFNLDIRSQPTLIDWFEVHWNYLHGKYNEKTSLFHQIMSLVAPALD